MTRYKVNGVRYNVEISGKGEPTLFLHGFMGSAADWQTVRAVLEKKHIVVAVDLLGHGNSDAPTDPARYSTERTIADLDVLLFNSLGFGYVNVVGYSLGGRVALSFAVNRKIRTARLVIESGSPGLADESEQAARNASDTGLADRIEREGIAPFLDYWDALPLFASQGRLLESTRAEIRERRLKANPVGYANSLRGIGTGVMPPLWDKLHTLYAFPPLFIAGALDTKYTEIAHRMAEHIPGAKVESVPDAGHNVHLEQPDVFIERVDRHLSEYVP
jgi:2-succinyl-6-hydroxy-2,4-cyclohexadiene-1-carboxylate synthase